MGSRFRSSFTQTQGHVPAKVVYGRIANINLVTWTVDVVAQFDRHKYFNIQISSPYLHPTAGEGFTVFPEVGACVMVCIPSDSAPPFVLCFVMPVEIIDDSSTTAPSGTQSHGQDVPTASNASFQGGRPRLNPGDIGLWGRDGNSIILHRGGVLSMGASPLSQRMFFPLGNLIMDISENYEHHNTNGSVQWGIQQGTSQSQIPSSFMQTFRVFANDAAADVRVSCGSFTSMSEPDAGVNLSEAGVAQDPNNPFIFEVAVSPKGFKAQTGEVLGPSTVTSSVFKFAFARDGGVLLRAEGNVLFQFDKQLTLKVKQAITIETEDAINFKAANGTTFDGGAFAHLKGDVVRLGEGTVPIARMQDLVSTSLAATPVIITFPSAPHPGPNPGCLLTTIAPMVGSIVSGNNALLG